MSDMMTIDEYENLRVRCEKLGYTLQPWNDVMRLTCELVPANNAGSTAEQYFDTIEELRGFLKCVDSCRNGVWVTAFPNKHDIEALYNDAKYVGAKVKRKWKGSETFDMTYEYKGRRQEFYGDLWEMSEAVRVLHWRKNTDGIIARELKDKQREAEKELEIEKATKEVEDARKKAEEALEEQIIKDLNSYDEEEQEKQEKKEYEEEKFTKEIERIRKILPIFVLNWSEGGEYPLELKYTRCKSRLCFKSEKVFFTWSNNVREDNMKHNYKNITWADHAKETFPLEESEEDKQTLSARFKDIKVSIKFIKEIRRVEKLLTDFNASWSLGGAYPLTINFKDCGSSVILKSYEEFFEWAKGK